MHRKFLLCCSIFNALEKLLAKFALGIAKFGTKLHVRLAASMYCVLMCVILVITQNGNSALMEAAYYGRTEVVVELVKAGALLDLQNIVCPYPIVHGGQEYAYSLVVYNLVLYMYVYMS